MGPWSPTYIQVAVATWTLLTRRWDEVLQLHQLGPNQRHPQDLRLLHEGPQQVQRLPVPGTTDDSLV